MSRSQTEEFSNDASSPAAEPRAGVRPVDGGAAEVLAVIPARGGSLGVPSKNILPLAGKPVICHTIDHARGSATVTRIVVSTDSDRIAKIARDYGAEVIMRPPELATASSRIDHALRHVTDTLLADEGYRPDVVVLLYANVPVRDPGITDRCVEHLLAGGAEGAEGAEGGEGGEGGGTSVRTFSDVGKFHPLWMSLLAGDRESPYGEFKVYRRQDLPKLYIHDGACVAIRFDVLEASRHAADDNFAFMGNDRRGIVQDAANTVEIDSARDLLLAEFIIEGRTARGAESEVDEVDRVDGVGGDGGGGGGGGAIA